MKTRWSAKEIVASYRDAHIHGYNDVNKLRNKLSKRRLKNKRAKLARKKNR